MEERIKSDRQKRRKRNRILRVIVIVFLTIMIASGIQIIKWLIENKQSKNISKSISNEITIIKDMESVNKYKVDFKNLKQTNSDVVAWLKVNGTNIEYPIVKTVDNEYYLNHSFNKSNNGAGWPFMDYKNIFNGKDKNIVIYGHNRKDGSMFGTLKNIFTDEWLNNKDNFIIPFISETEKAEYQVFSVYKVENEDYYITTNFETDSEFEEFIKKVKSRSIKDFKVDVTKDDQILTLSTCADNNKYRVVLHAKKIKK